MNRTIPQAAAVLGIGPRKLFARMRDLGLLDAENVLVCAERHRGRLFADPRSYWNPAIGGYTHYTVVMVTEKGIDWLADRLGITITRKGAAA